MTVSVVASASVGNTNNTDVTSVICNKPTGTVSGDFMVAVFTAPYTGSLTYTPPSGWTLVDSQNAGAISLWSGLYTKTAGGSEPSTYTWTCSGAGSMTVGIITYRGTDGSFNATSTSNPRKNSGTTTNPNLPSPLTSITGTGLATFACSWHDVGGSGDISTGSASQANTERWDIARTDGSPSLHERGSSAYTLDAEYTNGSNNPTSPSITLSSAPTAYLNWTWGLKSVVSGAGASTVPHFGSSFAANAIQAAYRSTSTAVSTAGTLATSLTIDKPTGTVDDDYMVAVISSNLSTITAPSGWTKLEGPTNDASGLSTYLYQKKAASEGSNYTWSFSAGGALTGSITSFSGSSGVDSWKSDVTSTTDPSVGSALTPINPSMRYDVYAWRDSGTDDTVTWSFGTETHDVVTNDTGTTRRGQSGMYVNDITAGGGTMGAPSADPTNSVTFGTMWSMAIASKLQTTSGTVASTVPHFGSALIGYVVPKGPIASTMPHFGSSLAGTVSGVQIEMLINGVWTNITEYIRYSQGVSITRGGSAESTTMTTSMCNLTLDNRDSRFSQENPTGPYYGYIGRNTQLRVTKVEAGYRFWGEISAWEPGADDTDTDRYVAIEASGLVRRLEAVASPLLPAIQREIVASSPLAYWPCDEQKGATSIASGLVGGARMGVSGTPDYGSYSDLKCSGPIPQIAGSTWSSPPLKGVDFTTGVTLAFLLSIPESGIASNSVILSVPIPYTSTAFPGGNKSYLFFEMLSTGLLWANATPLSGSSGEVTGSVPLVGTNGVMIYLALQKSTSNKYNFGMWYQGENDTSPIQVGTSSWTTDGTGTLASDAFKTFVFNPNQLTFGTTASVYIGHVSAWSGYGPGDGDVPSFASVGAYAGEPAGTRFARLCTEEGIDVTVSNPTNSSAMGPQLPKSLVSLLRECEATDLGVMYEKRDALGLGYIVRRDLYNQAATLTLDYSNGELATQLRPVYDDKNVQNDVTVRRDGGSSARYEVTTGRMSTSDAPDSAGRYDTSVTVSLGSDEQCYPQAGWRAHLGTVEGARITSVGVQTENARFVADPTLEADAFAVDGGSRIVVSNPPDWAGQEISQLCRGYSERFDSLRHEITYNTAPAKPYETAVAETSTTTTSAKADSLTSTLAADVSDSATGFTVAVTGVLWSTTAGDFDINVGGEQMTVTAVSGTSSPQTFTVTRSVNGIVKAHTAGAQVRLWKPAYVAL